MKQFDRKNSIGEILHEDFDLVILRNSPRDLGVTRSI